MTSFCEWAPTKPKKTPTWFALDDDRPLFAFAGIPSMLPHGRDESVRASLQQYHLYVAVACEPLKPVITGRGEGDDLNQVIADADPSRRSR